MKYLVFLAIGFTVLSCNNAEVAPKVAEEKTETNVVDSVDDSKSKVVLFWSNYLQALEAGDLLSVAENSLSYIQCSDCGISDEDYHKWFSRKEFIENYTNYLKLKSTYSYEYAKIDLPDFTSSAWSNFPDKELLKEVKSLHHFSYKVDSDRIYNEIYDVVELKDGSLKFAIKWFVP